MEHVLDHVFNGLGLDGSDKIDHPVIITEAVCNPNYSRAKMSKLLLECYGVPAVCYGVGDLFSYSYHHSHHESQTMNLPDGLIVSSSYEVTHVIPILDGRPDFLATVCIPVGGLQAHRFLFDALLLKYPQHARHLSLNRCHELNLRFSEYTKGNFLEELRVMQAWTDGDRTRKPQVEPVVLQLPFTEYVPKEESEEEKKRKEQRRKDHAERLRTLAAERRQRKMIERQKTLEGYDKLVVELEEGIISEEAFLLQLSKGGFDDRADFERVHKQLQKKVEDTIAKMQAKENPLEDDEDNMEEELDEEKRAALDREKFPLLFLDVSTLTEEQKKEKRKQHLMKSAQEGRARRRREKEEKRLELETKEKEEHIKYEKNPSEYIAELIAKRQKIIEMRGKRKQDRDFHDRRKNLASKRRMLQKVMGSGSSNGKGANEAEDNFGADDDDWQVYKKMAQTRGIDGEDDESESEAEKEEISWIEKLLMRYDPDALKREKNETQYPQASDFQIELMVERIKSLEVIYQPSIIGLEYAGLAEALDGVFRKLGPERRDRVSKNVVVIGGNTCHPNFVGRLQYHVRSSCPEGSEIKVCHAKDPRIGAW
eukprot:CAMPEP_0184494752 /NCGR_PEP_ID=MMETSP0113_2-20130426/29509_1 /TAXON_ID=91329 /ORGANISM="Norrisiella sphaerica, Strain BC52" /LENGTH=595 /DNA_ID=CAMNT_0026880633 /DNA_START=432 /DNA_END=2216 /DNA_ORIENTATION=+